MLEGSNIKQSIDTKLLQVRKSTEFIKTLRMQLHRGVTGGEQRDRQDRAVLRAGAGAL